jgi:aminopeptidase N
LSNSIAILGKNVLTEEEAKLRSAIVSNVAYDLALDIQGGGHKQYNGLLTITFDYKGQKDGTFLDFVGKEITKLDLNGNHPKFAHSFSLGTSLPSKDLFRENRVHLPHDGLKSSNKLTIHYTNDFDHSGEGLHQFIDPEDSQVKKQISSTNPTYRNIFIQILNLLRLIVSYLVSINQTSRLPTPLQ